MRAKVKGFDDHDIEKPPNVALGGQSMAVCVGSQQNPADRKPGFAYESGLRRL